MGTSSSAGKRPEIHAINRASSNFTFSHSRSKKVRICSENVTSKSAAANSEVSSRLALAIREGGFAFVRALRPMFIEFSLSK